MTEVVKKACDLSKKLLKQINEYCGQYTGVDGKDVVSELSIMALQEILEEGFALHNYLVEHNLFEDKPSIKSNLIQLEGFMNRLAITKEKKSQEKKEKVFSGGSFYYFINVCNCDGFIFYFILINIFIIIYGFSFSAVVF